MIALFVGPDAAMVRQETRALATERDPDDQSTSTLDGKIVAFKDVLMQAASVGFFGTGRVVIVQDLLARFGKQGGEKGDWAQLFASVPPENTLILADPSLGAVPAAVKKVLPKDALVKSCAPPRGPDLIRWLMRTATTEGASLSEADARFLAHRLYPQTWGAAPRNPAYDRPPDMELLRNELAKLAVAANGGQITKQQIESLVATGDDDQIFRFIEHAAAGRVGEAMVELDRLLTAGEDPAKLLAQLAQNAELAVMLDVAGRQSPETIGADIGLANPARMSAIARGMRGSLPGAATATVQAVTAADRGMKRGQLRDPKDALYDAILGIAARQRGR